MSPYYWDQAQYYCNTLFNGNRMGWRLPTFQELASLVDRTQSTPVLPAGHPFIDVQSSDMYWSATPKDASSLAAGDSDFILLQAWALRLGDGEAFPSTIKYFSQHLVWCVRGGQGVGPQ